VAVALRGVAVAGWQWYERMQRRMAVILVVIWGRGGGYWRRLGNFCDFCDFGDFWYLLIFIHFIIYKHFYIYKQSFFFFFFFLMKVRFI
jgi:hypothetical protein